MKVVIVAGEASGDRHAAAVARALRAREPSIELFGMGGDHCRAAGVEILYDAKSVSVMGITEVLGSIPRLLRTIRALAAVAVERKADVALLVDLPDFNLRLARRLTRAGVPAVVYVSPTVWAWREGRVKLLKRDVREVLCIYPFEEEFLRSRGVDAQFVGNPLLDDLLPAATERQRAPAAPEPLRLALIPGSRLGEVRRLFAPMLEAVKLLTQQRPVEISVPIAPTIPPAMLEETLAHAGLSARLVPDGTPEVLRWAHAAIVKSGTATLEAALAGVPMVVVYKASMGTAAVARAMLKVEHVSLPNLLLGRGLVPELLQSAATPQGMATALEDVLGRQVELAEGYRELRAKLGASGAAQRVAEAILRY